MGRIRDKIVGTDPEPEPGNKKWPEALLDPGRPDIMRPKDQREQ